MDDREKSYSDRRSSDFENLINRFFLEYHEGLAFLAGLTAYPIGVALFSLLGIR